MAQGYKQLVSALERRYDYHSARAVAAEALELAGLEKRSSYDGKEWAKLLKSTASAGDDLQGVWGALGEAPKGVKFVAESSSESASTTEVAPEPADEAPPAKPKKIAAKKAAAKKAPSKGKGKG